MGAVTLAVLIARRHAQPRLEPRGALRPRRHVGAFEPRVQRTFNAINREVSLTREGAAEPGPSLRAQPSKRRSHSSSYPAGDRAGEKPIAARGCPISASSWLSLTSHTIGASPVSTTIVAIAIHCSWVGPSDLDSRSGFSLCVPKTWSGSSGCSRCTSNASEVTWVAAGRLRWPGRARDVQVRMLKGLRPHNELTTHGQSLSNRMH